jgi:hypothetical protein
MLALRSSRFSHNAVLNIPRSTSLSNSKISAGKQTPNVFGNQRQVKRNYALESDEKLLVTFACPHQTIFKDRELKTVTVPGVSGKFGIMRKHVPIIAELKPGKLLHT